MAGESQQRAPLSVSQAVTIAKSILSEHAFKIVGEVSELSNKPGYKAVYFTIKDEKASLPCLMWKNRFQATGINLTLGARVEVTGKFTIFAPKGRMNFDVSHLTLAGEGDLRQKVAQLANRLRKEGLMDAQRKRPLVAFPETIGVVTSPRGAAVHDVLRTLRRRCPDVAILFAGVPVEGKQAHRGIIDAINCVVVAGAEEVLLVRGGGSFEDLMPFNEEELAYAIASCPVPVITGIGHEPDTSIADMVADLRCSTPTAAAESIRQHAQEVLETLDGISNRMESSLKHRLARSQTILDTYASRPVFKDTNALFATEAQTLDMAHVRLALCARDITTQSVQSLNALETRLNRSIPQGFNQRKVALDRISSRLRVRGSVMLQPSQQRVVQNQSMLSQLGSQLTQRFQNQAALVTSRLNDLSPLKTLERGWSIAKNDEGSIVNSINQVKPNDQLYITMMDGTVSCHADDPGVVEEFSPITWEDGHDR